MKGLGVSQTELAVRMKTLHSPLCEPRHASNGLA